MRSAEGEKGPYDAVEDGSIETIRLGRQLRFRPSAIIRYLKQRANDGNGGRDGGGCLR